MDIDLLNPFQTYSPAQLSDAIAAQGNAGLFLLVLIALGLILARGCVWFAHKLGVSSPQTALPNLSPRTAPLVLIIVIILGALIRSVQLYDSPWYDEAFSLRMALMNSSPQIWFTAWLHDVHPPLWYATLRIWYLIVGSDLGALRLLPLLMSLISIPILYRVARLLGASLAGALIAAGAFAVAPGIVYYGVELRSYAAVTLLMLLALWGGLRGRQWAWVILGSLPLWHYVALIYAIVLAAFLWNRAPRPKTNAIALACGCVGIAILSYLAQRTTIGNYPGWMEFHPGQIVDLLFIPLGWMDSRIELHSLAMFVFIFLASWVIVLIIADHKWRTFSVSALGIPVVVAVGSLVIPLWVSRVVLVCVVLIFIPAGDILARRPLVLLPMMCVIAASALFSVQAPYRINYRAAIIDGCTGASRIYATSIHIAFTASVNSHLPVVVWPGAQDNGQTFTSDELPVFGFEMASDPAAGDCIIYQHTSRTTQEEAGFVSSLIDEAPPDARIARSYQIAIYVWRI